jgi:hypothetical protein
VIFRDSLPAPHIYKFIVKSALGFQIVFINARTLTPHKKENSAPRVGFKRTGSHQAGLEAGPGAAGSTFLFWME